MVVSLDPDSVACYINTDSLANELAFTFGGVPHMVIKFTPSNMPPGKLADAELHFNEGPLEGLKLIGFGVWERRDGGRNVTFPARQYSVNGERRSFSLLRPNMNDEATERLRDLILEAYAEFERNVQ